MTYAMTDYWYYYELDSIFPFDRQPLPRDASPPRHIEPPEEEVEPVSKSIPDTRARRRADADHRPRGDQPGLLTSDRREGV